MFNLFTPKIEKSKYDSLSENYEAIYDEALALKQKVEKLEEENARLGNAMFEVINNETPNANATVKRMVLIAKVSLGLVKVDA